MDKSTKMTEAKFQSAFNKWTKYNLKESSVFELKICKDKSLPFSAVKPHQIRGLKAARIGLSYKLPDVGMDQKPFDCMLLNNVNGYVVVMFYKRGVKHFYIIDVDVWEKEITTSNRKSLTEERANQIGAKKYLN